VRDELLDRAREPPLLVDQLARAGQLRPVARQRDRAAAGVVGVDPLGLGHPADLAHRLVHGPPHRDGGSRPVPPRDAARRGREQSRAPAAVAARGAEARDLPFDDHDAQRRIELVQVVGGPEPGVARADDRDVRLHVPGQTRPRRERVTRRVVPERVLECHGRRNLHATTDFAVPNLSDHGAAIVHWEVGGRAVRADWLAVYRPGRGFGAAHPIADPAVRRRLRPFGWTAMGPEGHGVWCGRVVRPGGHFVGGRRPLPVVRMDAWGKSGLACEA
jgi:hypothetical protein